MELVLKLKHLLLVDGLTLAGARHRLVEEGATTPIPSDETITDADVAALMDKQTRRSLHDVRQGLGWILEVLDGAEATGAVSGVAARPGRSRTKSHVGAAKTVKSKRRSARPAKRQAKKQAPKRAAGRKRR